MGNLIHFPFTKKKVVQIARLICLNSLRQTTIESLLEFKKKDYPIYLTGEKTCVGGVRMRELIWRVFQIKRRERAGSPG